MISYYSRIGLIALSVGTAVFAQSINANEWRDSDDSRAGFSGFAPPSNLSYRNDDDDKQWGSGRTFNEENKVRYSPKVSKNPWKPIKSSHYKKTFSGQRPWGNVPDRKPSKTTNMKLHDQRFKEWIARRDSYGRGNAMLADPLAGYGRLSPLLDDAYGYPAGLYSSPLLTPAIHPGLLLNTGGYGLYPGALYPYSGLTGRPWIW